MKNAAGSTSDLVLFRCDTQRKIQFKSVLASIPLSIEAYLNSCIVALLKGDKHFFNYLEKEEVSSGKSTLATRHKTNKAR